MALIKHDQVVEDSWTFVAGDDPLPAEGKVTVELARWLCGSVADGAREIGVRIQPGDDVLELEGKLTGLTLVEVAFPKFTEGRGYSSARLLRDRLGYTGELRAVGDVLADQMFYMQRVGFDAFELKDGKSVENALAQLKGFSVRYQAAADDARPLFRRAKRPS